MTWTIYILGVISCMAVLSFLFWRAVKIDKLCVTRKDLTIATILTLIPIVNIVVPASVAISVIVCSFMRGFNWAVNKIDLDSVVFGKENKPK